MAINRYLCVTMVCVTFFSTIIVDYMHLSVYGVVKMSVLKKLIQNVFLISDYIVALNKCFNDEK